MWSLYLFYLPVITCLRVAVIILTLYWLSHGGIRPTGGGVGWTLVFPGCLWLVPLWFLPGRECPASTPGPNPGPWDMSIPNSTITPPRKARPWAKCSMVTLVTVRARVDPWIPRVSTWCSRVPVIGTRGVREPPPSGKDTRTHHKTWRRHWRRYWHVTLRLSWPPGSALVTCSDVRKWRYPEDIHTRISLRWR